MRSFSGTLSWQGHHMTLSSTLTMPIYKHGHNHRISATKLFVWCKHLKNFPSNSNTYWANLMDVPMPYLDAQIMIKGKAIMKMSLYYLNIFSLELSKLFPHK